MTARRIDVTVAREGGCWFAHRSDRPDAGPDRNGWVLVDAGAPGDVLAAFGRSVVRDVANWTWSPLYIGKDIAHGEVTVHG